MLDPSIGQQEYVEDCEICCRPMIVKYTIKNGEIAFFNAKAMEQ
jgi:hypothetical protein